MTSGQLEGHQLSSSTVCTHIQVRCFLIVYIGQLEIVACCQAFRKPGCLESVWRVSWPCEGYPSATHLGKLQLACLYPFLSQVCDANVYNFGKKN